MDPATIALIVSTLPVAVEALTKSAAAVGSMVGMMKKAHDEGRGFTAEEMGQFYALSDAAMAAWDNRAAKPAEPTPAA